MPVPLCRGMFFFKGNKDDSDYGVYDVKRGFGGNTLEYVGEFDLPIKKMLYRIYKLKNRLKGGK